MKQPWVVTAIGILSIAAGAAGFVSHMHRPMDRWVIVAALIGVLAVVGAVFLLMGRGWARWLLLVWLAFHVGISALDSLGKLAFHAVLLLVIGYALLRPPASEYFRAKRRVEP
jgi:hypothetical protein